VLTGFGILVMGLALTLTLSRSGIACFLLAMLLSGFNVLRRHTSKARFLAGGDIAFCDEPRPLGRVYFLSDRQSADVAFCRIDASDALIELVMHSFLLDIEARELMASHFNQLSRLVAQRIYHRLDYPRRFDMLTDVRNAIVGHCRG